MELPWVCLECGARQAAPGQCSACRRDDTLDLRDDKIKLLASDIETRLERTRESRNRLVGVVVGVATIMALWLVPGWWTVRAAMALPMLADQIMLMILVAWLVIFLLGRRARRRFPYLGDDLTIR